LHTVSPAPASTEALIGEGIAAAKSGDKTQAFELLSQALASAPRHEIGWLWLSGVVAGDAERYYCLEQVLAINPRNDAAQRGLATLPRGLIPTSPLAPRPPASEPDRAPAPLAAGLIAPLALPSLLVPDPPAAAPRQVTSLGLPKLREQPRQVEQPDPVFVPALIVAPAAPISNVQQADIDFVVRELGANHTAEQVSRLLCERKGYAWPDAQELVARVQMQHRTSIARRQAPFLLFLGVVTLIGGVALLGYAALSVSSFSAAPTAAVYVRSPYAYRNMIVAFCSGLMMTLGSSVGMVQIVRSMWT
jgi:hypothetical protein